MWNCKNCPGPLLRNCLVACIVVLASLPASATLGQDVSSIAADQAHLKTSVRLLTAPFYSIHEMRTAAGTTIRQFVSPNGTVFGVSWQGFPPNLEQLLGDYFQEYVREASTPGRRGRGVHIDTGDFVLDCGGHMRFVTGRAFLRSQLPAGVNASDIR